MGLKEAFAAVFRRAITFFVLLIYTVICFFALFFVLGFALSLILIFLGSLIFQTFL